MWIDDYIAGNDNDIGDSDFDDAGNEGNDGDGVGVFVGNDNGSKSDGDRSGSTFNNC